MAFATGYDMEYDFHFSDGLGKTYSTIAILWSILLVIGAAFLVKNRNLSFILIRNVHLIISAVAILHVYWLLCMVAYGLNGYFPCDTEFWIMNIYLPLGIALFHLSNTKLLQVSVLQRKYASASSLWEEKENVIALGRGWRQCFHKLKTQGIYETAKWLITLGLCLQLLSSLAIFLTSRKFHDSFGLVGASAPDSPSLRRQCRKGWEWTLSIVWQFLWSWLYAPYLLWKVRNIRDTHGWRTQTIVCCLASLPASPLWLSALYLPQMSIISTYFIPPLWFAPSLLLIEAFMIFQPCWQIVRHRRLKKETLEIITQWERQKLGSSFDSGSTDVQQSPRRMSQKSSPNSTKSNRKAYAHMYTMAALEKALQTNPTPLLLFAALKDFSGENISFLKHVQEWKKNWHNQRASIFRTEVRRDANHRHQQFAKAVEIYSSFVSLRFSTFPINISHNHLKELEAVFGESAAAVSTERADSLNSVTPFDDLTLPTSDTGSIPARGTLSLASTAIDTDSSATEIEMKSASKQSTVISIYNTKDLSANMPQNSKIPVGFGPVVFDNAVESVKYMVLTNTWPKFVDAGYAANMDKSTTMDRLHHRFSECGLGRSRICSF